MKFFKEGNFTIILLNTIIKQLRHVGLTMILITSLGCADLGV